MRVATKLSGALGLLMALMVTLMVHHVRTIRDAVSTSRELSEVTSQLALGSSRQLRQLSQLEENASKYVVTSDEGYRKKFGEVLRAYAVTQGELASLALRPDERTAVLRLMSEWAEARPLLEAFAAEDGFPSSEAESASVPVLRARLTRLRSQTRRIGEASQEVIASRLQHSADAARKAERLSLLAAAGALLLSVLVSVVIVRSITLALRRLQAGTHAVAGGDFSYRLPPGRGDEFTDLARDFNVMTQRLGELEQMKRDFLSKVSHDLKTPLASMQETTRILLDEVPGPLTQRQRKLLQLSDQSGKRLFSMISNILDLSGLEAGAFALSVRPCELTPLVRTARDQMEPMLLERRVTISLALPSQPVQLECDAERIVQVLINLLENAVKFSPADAEVRVEARVAGESTGSLLLTVADAGPGVPVADRERIFDRFFQAEAGRQARGRGVGLGLSICREIVAAHGGTMWVEGNPAGGSVFCVLLSGVVREPQAARRDRAVATG
jgi:two-component system sensor histidine kinase GlrK